MKYGFAGNRQISIEILSFLIDKGYPPSFIIIGDVESSQDYLKLIEVSELDKKDVFHIKDLNINLISELYGYDVDYIFGIHFPYIIYNELLNIPKIGFLNLHPAFLPYNKGWHTPSWAILENTQYGATLHFMSSELDSGDIIAQKELVFDFDKTANQLYQEVLQLEKDLFIETFDELLSLKPRRLKQIQSGTIHHKKNLLKIQEINLDEKVYPIDLINLLRALTTNDISESAFFVSGNKKYHVQINIVKFEI